MPALNIAFAFEDALRSVEQAGTIKSPALPTLVFHMQGDVINSYRHAMDHYLTIPLDAPYLQNSSLGSPYQKWLTVTNDNFKMLQFCTYNLLRYTSRLWHETEAPAMLEQPLYDEHSKRSNAYTSPIVMQRMRTASIGYRALPEEKFCVTSVRSGPPPVRVIGRGTSTGEVQYFRIDTKDGRELEIPIDREESQRHMSPLVEEHMNIRDRSILERVKSDGHKEIAQLSALHDGFGEACRRLSKVNDPFSPFVTLNQEYWI